MYFSSKNVNLKHLRHDHDYGNNNNNNNNNNVDNDDNNVDNNNNNNNDDDDNKIKVGNMSITDDNMEEIEKLIPSVKKPVTKYQLRLNKAARRILKHPCAVISNCSLVKRIDNDAANFLVEECLLLFAEDLFNDYRQLEPEGYVKYIPEIVDLNFMDRLLRYDIHPTIYLKNINIPDIWVSYLSINGIKFLTSMNCYRNMLSLLSLPQIHIISSNENELQSISE